MDSSSSSACSRSGSRDNKGVDSSEYFFAIVGFLNDDSLDLLELATCVIVPVPGRVLPGGDRVGLIDIFLAISLERNNGLDSELHSNLES